MTRRSRRSRGSSAARSAKERTTEQSGGRARKAAADSAQNKVAECGVAAAKRTLTSTAVESLDQVVSKKRRTSKPRSRAQTHVEAADLEDSEADELVSKAGKQDPSLSPNKRRNPGTEESRPAREQHRERSRKARRKGAAKASAQDIGAMQDRLARDPFGLARKTCLPKNHSSAKNCAGNPNCVYGLGEKRQGIWGERASRFLSALAGKAPEVHLREPGASNPAGLKNLGATCYVNAQLQTLFMNPVVRKLIYSYEVPSEERSAGAETIKEMQRVFAHLQEGMERSYDLSRFVEVLGVSKGEQQDAQEFNKLLLAFLASFGKGNPALEGITRLYTGELAYITRCSGCSKSSKRKEVCFELSVQIKGLGTIENCIAQYAEIEELKDHNKYECLNCKGKRDAERSIRVRKLPDVLNIQLMRFMYDLKTGMRKKLKDAIVIGDELDFGKDPLRELIDADYAASLAPEALRFRLVAILHHKGAQAVSGHYVADVLDRSRQPEAWFTFNDTSVSRMEPRTAGSRSAYQLVYERVSPASSFPVQVPRALLDAVAVSNEAHKAQQEAHDARKQRLAEAAEARRKLYRDLFGQRKNSRHIVPGVDEDGFWVPTAWVEAWATGKPIRVPVSAPVPAVAAKEEVIDVDIDDLEPPLPKAETVGASEQVLEPKREEGAGLFSEPPDLQPFLCAHSDPQSGILLLAPEACAKLKRISAEAYRKMLATCSPSRAKIELPCDAENMKTVGCTKCTGSYCSALERVKMDSTVREGILKVLDAENVVLASLSPAATAEFAFISRKWITQWKRFSERQSRGVAALLDGGDGGGGGGGGGVGGTGGAAGGGKPGKDIATMLGASDEPCSNINSSITCEHGALSLSMAGKRVIPLQDWTYILEHALEGRCKGETTTFLVSDGHCVECQETQAQSRSAGTELRARKDKQTKDAQSGALVRTLLKRRCGHPNLQGNALPVGRYHCVPRSWMSLWREFHKHPANACEPGSLQDALSKAMRCSKHGRPFVNKRLLHWLRRDNTVKAASLLPPEQVSENVLDSQFVELLSEREWEVLRGFYGQEEGLAAVSVQVLHAIDVRRSAANADSPSFRFDVELCDECIDAEEESSDLASRVYANKMLQVTVLSPGQSVPNADAAAAADVSGTVTPAEATAETEVIHVDEVALIHAADLADGRRRSGRQKTKAVNGEVSKRVQVNSSDTVDKIKLELLQQQMLDEHVYPTEYRVFHRGRRIVDTTKTLEDCGIRCDDHIYVQRLAEVSNEVATIADWLILSSTFALGDAASQRPAADSGAQRKTISKETGFKGSILVGQ